MTRQAQLKHEFVEFIPDHADEGVLYVSIPYATAVHKCCCGCGTDVVTPLTPTDWKLIFDGESVSLHPSIGNWSFRCQSHYWIKNGRVVWAGQWSKQDIDAGRAHDRAAKTRHYAPSPTLQQETQSAVRQAKPGFWERLRDWLSI